MSILPTPAPEQPKKLSMMACRRCGAALAEGEACPKCSGQSKPQAAKWVVGALTVFAVAGAAAVWWRPALVLEGGTPGASVTLDGRPLGTVDAVGRLQAGRVERGARRLVVQGSGAVVERDVHLGLFEFRKLVRLDNRGQAPAPIGQTQLPQATLLARGSPLPAVASLTTPDSSLMLWYRDAGPNVALAIRANGNPVLIVDTNQNGAIDEQADRSYAASRDGKICAQFVHAQGTPARCDEAQTAATVDVKAGSPWEVFWLIPKSELGPPREGAFVCVQVFDAASQSGKYYPAVPFQGSYRLSFGSPATAAPPVAQTSALVAPPPKIVILKEPSVTLSADQLRVSPGTPVRLSWTTANAASATLGPALGAVELTGDRVVRPQTSTTYEIVAQGGDGKLAQASVRVEVIEPLVVQGFAASAANIRFDDEFTLSWKARGASELSVELVSKPIGSRAFFTHTTSDNESQVAVRVDREQFTRYGSYEYRLVAKGFDGSTKEKRITVTLPPGERR